MSTTYLSTAHTISQDISPGHLSISNIDVLMNKLWAVWIREILSYTTPWPLAKYSFSCSPSPMRLDAFLHWSILVILENFSEKKNTKKAASTRVFKGLWARWTSAAKKLLCFSSWNTVKNLPQRWEDRIRSLAYSYWTAQERIDCWCTYCQHVLCQDEFRQIFTVPNWLCHLRQPILVHLEDGELLQLTWPGQQARCELSHRDNDAVPCLPAWNASHQGLPNLTIQALPFFLTMLVHSFHLYRSRTWTCPVEFCSPASSAASTLTYRNYVHQALILRYILSCLKPPHRSTSGAVQVLLCSPSHSTHQSHLECIPTGSVTEASLSVLLARWLHWATALVCSLTHPDRPSGGDYPAPRIRKETLWFKGAVQGGNKAMKQRTEQVLTGGRAESWFRSNQSSRKFGSAPRVSGCNRAGQ